MGEARIEEIRMRKPHYLKPTAGSKRPSRLIFFDTETNQQKGEGGSVTHTLKIGVGLYCERNGNKGLEVIEEKRFTDGLDFWEWVASKSYAKSTLYIVAHNIVFDIVISGGFRHMLDLGYAMTSWYSKGLVSIIRYRKDDRKIVMIDNGNFFAGKLAKWGKVVGLEKMEIDFNHYEDDYLWTYCRRDTEIMVKLWSLWLAFLVEHDNGDWKPTVASTSFNTWRHRYLNTKVYIHADEAALELEREAYHGGRTEAFWVGENRKGRFFYADINNLYGYIMANNQFPTILYGTKEKSSLWDLANKLSRYAVIGRVLLNTHENAFAYKVKGHQIYPLGRFWTTLTTPELKFALINGWIEEVGAIAWYKQEELFRDFVTDYYKIRQDYKKAGNPGMAKIAKLLVNSLYGKFGQRGFNQDKIGECGFNEHGTEKIYNIEKGVYETQTRFAGGVFREVETGESYNSFPAIAAHVTAYGRLYMKLLFNTVTPGHAFYMDTDSLIVDEVGLSDLTPYLHETRLGSLKIEHESEDLSIYAPKDYRMGDRVKVKGIRKTAQQIDQATYLQDKWPGLRGIIRAGDYESITVTKVIKHQRRQVFSGQVSASGWVIPWYFPNPDFVPPFALRYLAPWLHPAPASFVV